MEPTEDNLRAWEEAHRRHAARTPDRPGLPAQVRRALGELKGKRVLHLGCGTGAGTAELAERGAVVTGVDVEGAALDAARERWPSILWVEADPQDLPAELRRGRFDLAYAGGGSRSAPPLASGDDGGITARGADCACGDSALKRCGRLIGASMTGSATADSSAGAAIA